MTDIRADFFISRAGADAATAKLIAGIIRGAGKVPFSQDEDFGSADFMRRMEQAYEGCERVVALLSPHSPNIAGLNRSSMAPRAPQTARRTGLSATSA